LFFSRQKSQFFGHGFFDIIKSWFHGIFTLQLC
jgi:hypothetical protein